jgi:SP family sugar:H+ symporter-like MFS transporter
MVNLLVWHCDPKLTVLSTEIDAMFLSRTPAWRSRHFKVSQANEEALQSEKRTNRDSEHQEKVRNSQAPHSPSSSEA